MLWMLPTVGYAAFSIPCFLQKLIYGSIVGKHGHIGLLPFSSYDLSYAVYL